MKTAVVLLLSAAALAAELHPRTEREFEQYAARAQREMASGPIRFPVRAGEEPRVGPWGADATEEVHDGLIHDWVGALFVPGATASQAVALLTDFDRHRRIYAPEVAGSKLISRESGLYRSSLRLVKKKVITVTLDTEYETRYTELSPGRWLGVVRSTRIQEVDNAGEPDERLKPERTGHGFLWRLNSWWVVEERDGGVLLQLRSISLTRGIPLAVSWIVKPMVTSLPRESLEATLEKTALALRVR